MARRYIKDLPTGEIIEDEIFLLTQKDLRMTSNGAYYIHAVLADKTAQMPARVWQASQELYDTLPQDGFVRVRGRTESYKGSLQFIIEGIRPIDPGEVDLDEFLPKTEKDIDAMYSRVIEILRKIQDRNVLFLVKQFVEDQPLMAQFKRAPAAVQVHHAYIGGLLEHTLNILELAMLICPRYPQINMDLMLAGTFLHDIGKTTELASTAAFKYTDTGQLIGHSVIATMMLEQKVRQARKDLGRPFPDRLLRVLEHMILSHHGDYQFGSARLPSTPEAIALHYLDNLDAKLELCRREIAEANATDPDANWTTYVRSLERRLFKADPFAAPTDEPEPPNDPA